MLGGTAPLHIETSRMTLASLCKSQGYRTAVVGKWHLGLGSEAKTDWNKPLKPGPLEIGFDYFFGMGSNPWTGPHSFIENHEVTNRVPGEQVVIKRGREGAEHDQRHHQAVRIQPDHEGDDGEGGRPGSTRTTRARSSCTSRPTPSTGPSTPTRSSPAAASASTATSSRSWTGPSASCSRPSTATSSPTTRSSSSPATTAASSHPNNAEAQIAIKAGLAINGSLRGGKHDVWEGGFRTPFLVRWPGKVPAGTTSEQVVCHTDMLATLAGILKVPLPQDAGEDSFDAGRALFETTAGEPVRDHVIVHSADADVRHPHGQLEARRARERPGGRAPPPRPAGGPAAAQRPGRSGGRRGRKTKGRSRRTTNCSTSPPTRPRRRTSTPIIRRSSRSCARHSPKPATAAARGKRETG